MPKGVVFSCVFLSAALVTQDVCLRQKGLILVLEQCWVKTCTVKRMLSLNITDVSVSPSAGDAATQLVYLLGTKQHVIIILVSYSYLAMIYTCIRKQPKDLTCLMGKPHL